MFPDAGFALVLSGSPPLFSVCVFIPLLSFSPSLFSFFPVIFPLISVLIFLLFSSSPPVNSSPFSFSLLSSLQVYGSLSLSLFSPVLSPSI